MMNKFDFHEIQHIPVHMLYRKRHLDLVILNARSYFYVTRSMPFGSVTPGNYAGNRNRTLHFPS